MRQSTILRELVKRKQILVAPGIQAALFARVAQDAGFEALYATGAGISNLQLGLPDLGLATMTEILETVRALSTSRLCRHSGHRQRLRGPSTSIGV